MKNEERWKQRFTNFEKAYRQLEMAFKADTEHDPLMRAERAICLIYSKPMSALYGQLKKTL